MDMTAQVGQTLFQSLDQSGITNLQSICLRFNLFEQAPNVNIDGLVATLARQESLHTLWLSDGNYFTSKQTAQILDGLTRSNCKNTLKMLSLRHSNFETKECA